MKAKKERRIKVLLIHLPSGPSFASRDYAIIKKHFEVRKVRWDGKRTIPSLLSNLIWSDVVYSWFAGDHSSLAVLFSKLFRKKTIICVGGGDVAAVPELDYGLLLKEGFKKKFLAYGIENASKVMVVDPSLKQDAIKNAGVSGKNIVYLPTGYDTEYWKPSGDKERLVITTGKVTKTIVRRKSFDIFVKAAREFPDVKFAVIGKHADNSVEMLKSLSAGNVEFPGFVSDDELLRWNQRASVYCQLSRYEGLPNALCEAMSCGCVPVGTRHCGVPTAIGGTGFYAEFSDLQGTIKAIRQALASPENSHKARQRIIDNFPLSKRRDGVIRAISEVRKK